MATLFALVSGLDAELGCPPLRSTHGPRPRPNAKPWKRPTPTSSPTTCPSGTRTQTSSTGSPRCEPPRLTGYAQRSRPDRAPTRPDRPALRIIQRCSLGGLCAATHNPPCGVRLVISDQHRGLTAAVGKVLPGVAWQRCRVHFQRNVAVRVPKHAAEMVAATIRTIFAQPTAELVRAQVDVVADLLTDRFPAVAAMLLDATADVTAFADFPEAHWRKI